MKNSKNKNIFKKIAVAIIISFFLISISSCARVMKDFSADMSYKDPQTLGGRWNVYTEGRVYENCKCEYWGAEGDENACFKLPSGELIFVNGTYSVIEVFSNGSKGVK